MSFVSCRKKAGLTQDKAAEALSVSVSAISLWETGGAVPKANRLPEIAKLYGCSIEMLLDGNPKKIETVAGC